MDRLWAPWRANYIRASSLDPIPDRRSACFLCDGIAGTEDRANLLVWRRKQSAVFLNKYPYNNGHLLVCPLLHRGSLGEFSGEELTGPLETIRDIMSVLARILRPQGYNVGLNQGRTAGAGLPDHLHWHIVPRWDGDANFMPVLSETKVIVESLDEFYDRFAAEVSNSFAL